MTDYFFTNDEGAPPYLLMVPGIIVRPSSDPIYSGGEVYYEYSPETIGFITDPTAIMFFMEALNDHGRGASISWGEQMRMRAIQAQLDQQAALLAYQQQEINDISGGPGPALCDMKESGYNPNFIPFTKAGEDAALFWANAYLDDPWYFKTTDYFNGCLSSLWMRNTADKTLTVLFTAYSVADIAAETGPIVGWKGGEITLKDNPYSTPDFRFNPTGSKKGEWYDRLPHYHRRPGIGKHRPWRGGF